ncbi:unnamed protein product, partial [Polarella glacialis]
MRPDWQRRVRPGRRAALSSGVLAVLSAVALSGTRGVGPQSAAFLLCGSPGRTSTSSRLDDVTGDRGTWEQGDVGRTNPLRQLRPGGRARRSLTTLAATDGEKQLDTDAVVKYVAAASIQILAIAAFFAALDTAVASSGVQVPDWGVFLLFFGLSIRSRIFSPLDNARPDINKAMNGEASGGFNDRVMPSWTPPGITFPIMWILIVAPLRAASSVLIWQQVGHFCDITLLALMLHLAVGDTWNTVNNVEKRLGAAVPGVLCVWASAVFAAFSYYQVVPQAGQLLAPTC